MTKKLTRSLPWLLVVILAGFLFVRTGSNNALKAREAILIKEAVKLQRGLDSLSVALEQSGEAIERADAIILGYKAEVVRAQAKTKEIQKRYDSIHFKPFSTDSARYNALRLLYPSERFWFDVFWSGPGADLWLA